MRKFGWAGAALLLALAACTQVEPDPLAQARRTCADAGAEAEARMEACSALIESGSLEGEAAGEVYAARGDANAEAGDVTAALRDYQSALQAAPDYMAAVMGRAAILIDSGQLDAAEPLTTRLLDSGEHNAMAHYLIGRIAQARGDSAGAIAAYDLAISADGRMADAFARRGALRQAQQDWTGALADLDAALGLNPQLAPAYASRCWTRVLMPDGDLARARGDAADAVRYDPRGVQGQMCKGLLHLREEQWGEARAAYEAALEVEPGNPAALFGRGIARRRDGDNGGRVDMNLARDFEPNIGSRFDQLGVRSY